MIARPSLRTVAPGKNGRSLWSFRRVVQTRGRNRNAQLGARRRRRDAGDAVAVDDAQLQRRRVRRLLVEYVLDVAAQDFADGGRGSRGAAGGVRGVAVEQLAELTRSGAREVVDAGA